jgi:hypothetical protein
MKYHKVYLITIFENVYLLRQAQHRYFDKLLAQVFLIASASLKITCLKFDIELYFNSLSIQVLGLISNSTAVLHLSRTRLKLNLFYTKKSALRPEFRMLWMIRLKPPSISQWP